MSVFDCLKKNTRLPLYIPPLRWREEHLEHLRVSQTVHKLELPTVPGDILDALNPIPGSPAPRSRRYVDLRSFCEAAVFDLLDAIGLEYKHYSLWDRHCIDLTIKNVKVPIIPDSVVYAHTEAKDGIERKLFIAILSSVQESRLPGAAALKMMPKRYLLKQTERKYPLSPYAFAALLAIAQNQLLGCRGSEVYNTQLVYIEADCSVTLISAEFSQNYLDHVMTGQGELAEDEVVKLKVLGSLSGPGSWSSYQPFLWLVKQHFETDERFSG